jgi:hypothetical protein
LHSLRAIKETILTDQLPKGDVANAGNGARVDKAAMARHHGKATQTHPQWRRPQTKKRETRRDAMLCRRFVRAGLVPAVSLLCLVSAHGQDYPNRQLTIVVGVAPGGITDVSTRVYADAVTRNLGQKIIIENRPAGGGSVAAAAVQNSPPDGYTLLSIVGAQFCSQPAMQPAPYDPIKGFAPVTLLFRLPALLLVPADSPASSVAELLELAKTKPGGLSFGSPGAGSPGRRLQNRQRSQPLRCKKPNNHGHNSHLPQVRQCP